MRMLYIEILEDFDWKSTIFLILGYSAEDPSKRLNYVLNNKLVLGCQRKFPFFIFQSEQPTVDSFGN